MRGIWKVAAVAVGFVALPMMAAPAGAVTGFPVAGYGFDGQAHVIVGGGSDTTYAAMLSISQLYMRSSLTSCGPLHQAGGAGAGANTNLNECTSNTDNDSKLGNYQGDTVAQANAVGSSGGVRSLNGFGETGTAHTNYQGTVNPVGAGYDASCINQTTLANVDFARSSSGPTTSGSSRVNATCGGTGDDRAADTFWGYARDGITWTAFNNRATQIRSLAASGALAPADIRKMYDCTYTLWSQVPGMSATAGFVDGPIVPWTMNDASGTRGTGLNFLINQGGAPAGFNPDTQTANGGPCTQYLGGAPESTGIADVAHKPLENDIKALVNNHPLSTVATSRDNPDNWVWWGSFGVFNAFGYTSKVTGLSGAVPSVTAGFLPVNGIIPSPSRVFNDGSPSPGLGAGLGRTLFHVTRKADADCPHAVAGDLTCAFVANPGPAIAAGGTDLNVLGASGGIGGAVREFTRFMCRPSAVQQGNDPLTGVNNNTELSNAINGAGFQTVNGTLATPGSRCAVTSK